MTEHRKIIQLHASALMPQDRIPDLGVTVVRKASPETHENRHEWHVLVQDDPIHGTNGARWELVAHIYATAFTVLRPVERSS